MTIAAVLPALHALGSFASFASLASSAGAGLSAGEPGGGPHLDRMQAALHRQEAAQMQTMELQTQANIRKLFADTANSIASGQLDSGVKMQNALFKAAQNIHF